jgi:hypothetical protein
MKAASFGQFLECQTLEDRPVWPLLKEFLDTIKIGERFTREEKLDYIYTTKHRASLDSYVTNADLYRRYLINIGFVEFVRSTVYLKKYNIPKNASLQLIMKYSYPKKSWKNWFIPPEDRIKEIYRECKLNHVL